MKNWIKKHKNEIITGIIVTIIVSIIHWVFNSIKQGLPIAGNAIFSALINELYSRAAIHNGSSASLILLLILFGWSFATILFFSIKLLKLRFERNKIEKLKKQIEQISESTVEPVVRDAAGDEKKEREVEKTIEALLKDPKKKERKHKVISIIGIVVVSIYLLWASISIIYPIVLWNAFDISTIQIKPYISDIEMDNLKSRWTLMKSREDFDEINSYILQIREENGLIR